VKETEMRKAAGPAITATVMIALVASIIVPNLLKAMDRSRQKRTMADMRTIATALEARATDLSSYAIVPYARHTSPGKRVEAFGTLHRETFADLERALVPKYIRKLPRQDGWGEDFDIRTGNYNDKGEAMLYALRSYGRDGRAEGDSYTARPIQSFDEDIVYAEGQFFQYPEGTCSN
jgi:general secretion pathway protein G